MADITHNDPVVTESKLTEFYNDIKPFLGCPAYLTSEGNAEYYSTDEKVIGRWTDGKPLYQKVIDLGVLTNNKTVNHNISNLDTVVDVQGMAYNGTGQYLKLAFINLSNSYYGSLIVDKTKISIIASGITDRSGFAILNYTKTTDSAATTMQEDPNEYSTTEKIVGKWIDGKPLYQKTFKYSSGGGDTSWSTQGVYLTTSNNIKDIISCDTTFMWENNWQSAPYYEVENDMDKVFVIVDGTTHNLALFHKIKTAANVDVYATIKYTKTTD